MQIDPLYLDFFCFLDQWQEGDPWPVYERYYWRPHETFLRACWERNFGGFLLPQVRDRVRGIKKGDYGLLQSLVQGQDPGELARGALNRCRSIFAYAPAPAVVLFVGFFSADGKTISVEGSPVIAIGLERFRNFRDLALLVGHEYAHCAQHVFLKDSLPQENRPLSLALLAEGLATHFTQRMAPEIPEHRHLFLTRERFHWCRQNKEALMNLAGAQLDSAGGVPVLFGPGDPAAGLPPRVGYFIAHEMVSGFLENPDSSGFGSYLPESAVLLGKILKSGGRARGDGGPGRNRR
jgi:hypothetical protein